MKQFVIIIILFFVLGFSLGILTESKLVKKFKVQAVNYGYAHVVVIDNKLEWEWIKPDMQMYYTDDESNDIAVDEESTFWEEMNEIKSR